MLKAQARRSARGSRKVGTIILILALAELLDVYSAAPVARQQGVHRGQAAGRSDCAQRNAVTLPCEVENNWPLHEPCLNDPILALG
jgi:hypothetical protein